MPSSVVSKSSQRSKLVSKNSEVDETLFGSSQRKQDKQNDDFKKVKTEVPPKNAKAQTQVITESELYRMKNNAVVQTREQQLQQKKINEEQKEKQLAAAKLKKEKMLRLEEEKKKNIPLNEFQQEELEQRQAIIERANKIQNEQIDDVKNFNKMVNYSKCVTIRDQQLLEKKQIQEELKLQERRKDLKMEVERLKSIKKYDQQDQLVRDKKIQGHHIIVQQMEQREIQRQQEKKLQEAEGQVMLKTIKNNLDEDRKAVLKKQEFIRQTQDEIKIVNEQQKLLHEKKINKEKEEVQRIADYNQKKAEKEAAYQAEQQRIKDEKEKEVQRLREQQEKASDRQSELDALRARRATEANERQARENEKRKALEKEKQIQDLLDARRLQTLEKEHRLQEQAKIERDEFQRVIQVQKLQRESEIKLEREKSELLKKNSNDIRKQITINTEIRNQIDRDRLEEGKKIQAIQNDQMKLISSIKNEKLAHMQDLGISNKYTSELERKKVVL